MILCDIESISEMNLDRIFNKQFVESYYEGIYKTTSIFFTTQGKPADRSPNGKWLPSSMDNYDLRFISL